MQITSFQVHLETKTLGTLSSACLKWLAALVCKSTVQSITNKVSAFLLVLTGGICLESKTVTIWQTLPQ